MPAETKIRPICKTKCSLPSYMPSNVDGVEHAGNAQIHTQKLCSEYFNQIFAFSDAWQMPFNPHLSHFGLRAVHTYRPCRISQWCALGIKASGI